MSMIVRYTENFSALNFIKLSRIFSISREFRSQLLNQNTQFIRLFRYLLDWVIFKLRETFSEKCHLHRFIPTNIRDDDTCYLYWIILEINGAAAASRKMILYRRLFFYLTLVNNLCSFSRWSGKKFDAYAFFLIEIRFVQLLKLKRGKDILIHRTCNSLNGIF